MKLNFVCNRPELPMKLLKTLSAIIFLFATVGFAADTRYKDRLFEVEKDSVVIDSVPHLVAGTNQGTLTSLLLLAQKYGAYNDYIMYFYKRDTLEDKALLADVYRPVDDNITNRPLVLVLHGGAFVAGERNDLSQKTVAYCDSLAARGFVTASLGYRKGVVMQEQKDPSDSTKKLMTVDSSSFARTVYRGAQDVRAAVRFFRENADEFGIDTNKIFIMGNSAGAILGLENIFALEEDDYPDYIDVDTLAALGNIDDYGPLGYGSTANGLVSLWGAIHNPKLLENNRVPVFLAHGDGDETVYYGAGRPLEQATSSIREKDTRGILENINFEIHTPTLYGSQIIDSVLTANNIHHEMFFLPGAGHEFYDDTLFVENEDGSKTVAAVYEELLRPSIFDFLFTLATDSYELDLKKALASVKKNNVLARKNNAPSYLMDVGNAGFTLTQGENVGYAVYNLQGRKVLGGRASSGTHVDLSTLGKGVYTLLVRGARGKRFGISR